MPHAVVFLGIALIIGMYTLRMLTFINVDLAIRFQYWLRNLVYRIERKLDEMGRDDD